jgi:hypothetical protein
MREMEGWRDWEKGGISVTGSRGGTKSESEESEEEMGRSPIKVVTKNSKFRASLLPNMVTLRLFQYPWRDQSSKQ